MRDRLAEFADAEVVVITFTRPRNLAGFRKRFVAPLTVVADEDRDVYGAYLDRPDDQEEQLGGDFVVGRDGRLVYVFRSKGHDDRPTVDELIEAVREAATS